RLSPGATGPRSSARPDSSGTVTSPAPTTPNGRRGLRPSRRFQSRTESNLMTLSPKPSAAAPDTDIYERRESAVRSYCVAMPRQFNRAEGVWLHDDNGGRYLDFLSGCSSL